MTIRFALFRAATVVVALATIASPAEAQRRGRAATPAAAPSGSVQIAPGTVAVPRGTLVIRNLDAVWTAAGDVKRNATIVIADGRIVSVGDAPAQVPAGARELDGRGLTAIPGLVDEHSHIGMLSTNEGTAPITAEVRVADALDASEFGIYRALSGGVTTALVLHGSANPIGGQSAIIKTRWRVDDSRKLLVEGAPRTIKFALGENVTRKNFRGSGVQRWPGSRAGVEAMYVQAFEAAKAYRAAWQAYEANPRAAAESPRRDLRLEALVDILEGRLRVHAHSYRSDEITMLIDIAERYGFRIDAFTHVLEGYKVADEIARHGAGASTFSDWWQYKVEAYDAIPYNAAVLHRQGVLTSINSDIPWLQSFMVYEFNKPVKYGGLSKEESLRMLTAYPAKQLRLDDRVGTLEPGKDGDVVLLSGDPFNAYSRVEKTIVDGLVYYDRTAEATTRGEPVRAIAAMPASVAARSAPVTAGLGGATPAAPADGAVTALVGATVHPVSGAPIADGVVLVRGGRIAAVGAAGAVAVPAGATVVRLDGKHLYPGMIEPMSQLGVLEIEAVPAMRDDEEVGRYNPHLTALWSVHPHSEAIPVARANGVTTALAIPSTGDIPGTASVIQLAGDTPKGMAVAERAALVLALPAAKGNAWDKASLEGERLEALVALLERARQYAARPSTNDDPVSAFDPNDRGGEALLLQALVPAITGQQPVLVKARTERELRTLFLLLDRFPTLKVTVVGGDQAHRVADELARRRIAVIVGSALIPTLDRDDPVTAGQENAARLHAAGVTVAFTTNFSPNSVEVRNLPYHAAKAASFGLPTDAALRGVTLSAAEALGLAHELGSIEPGKRADLVVTDGDILQLVTNVERVWIGGVEQSVESRHTRLWRQFKDR